MSGLHARLSASAAHRWLKCPGSIDASQRSETSPYAAQGTRAHAIAAECLERNKKPSAFLDTEVDVEGHMILCDQEMVDGVQVYLDAIQEDAEVGDINAAEMPLLEVMQKIDPDLGGTADYVRYRPSTQHLKVMDFKYGAGTYVEADDNEQMKLYALGAMLSINAPVKEVEVVVVQPRFEGAKPVRPWSFKATDILAFIADVKEAADRTRQPNPPLVAGEWCKPYCPRRRTCPELERKTHELMAQEFGEVVDPAKLSAMLTAIPLIKARITAIEEFAYKEATAGREVPGYKLVDKRPVRRWKSEGDVIEWAQANALECYKPREPLTPKQIEDKLKESAPRGKKKDAGAVLEPFVEKVSSGTVLVPVTDNRQEAKRITADDFPVINQEP